MGRAPCCEKMGLKKGPWSSEEDQILISYIQLNGHGNWRALPKLAGNFKLTLHFFLLQSDFTLFFMINYYVQAVRGLSLVVYRPGLILVHILLYD